MQNMITDSFAAIDYFHLPLQMIFNRKEYISTFLSKSISIVIYAVSIALAINMGSSIYSRLNPTVTQIDKQLSLPPNITLANSSLIFIAQFQDDSNQAFDDPTYFNIEIIHFLLRRNETGSTVVTKYPIPKTNCSIYYDHYDKLNMSSIFIGNNFNIGYCFDNNYDNMTIGGAFTSNYFSEINYKLKPCVNSTLNKNFCKTPAQIAKKINGGTFAVNYINYFVDTDNFDNPFLPYLTNYNIKIDVNLKRSTNVLFKTAKVNSDVGLIFSSFDNETNYIFDTVQEQYTFYTGSEYLSIYLASSSNLWNVSRIYMKIQTLAATVGGIFNIMVVIGNIVASFFNKYKIYENLINSLFYIESETDDPIKIRSSIKRISLAHEIKKDQMFDFSSNKSMLDVSVKQNNFIGNSVRQVLDSKDRSKSNIDTAIFKVLNDQKIGTTQKNLSRSSTKSPIKKIRRYTEHNVPLSELKQKKLEVQYKLGVKEVLSMKILSCCNSKEKRANLIFMHAYDELMKYFDYLEVAQILLEFRQMKKIIFDHDQEELFSYCKKPEIDGSKTHIHNKFDDGKLNSIFNIYKKVFDAQKDDRISKRLLVNLDDDVKAFFEATIASAKQ